MQEFCDADDVNGTVRIRATAREATTGRRRKSAPAKPSPVRMPPWRGEIGILSAAGQARVDVFEKFASAFFDG